ncbi:MAG: DUF2306 domain-containing protein [Pseudomonadota bacterium]
MSPDPIFDASLAIRLHLAAIALAIVATAVILPLPKGTVLHRTVGMVWVAAMMTAALVSFGIRDPDPEFSNGYGLSPIHILSVVVLISVPNAVWQIRKGRVEAHRRAMISLVIGALGIAGLFTFIPGRLMWQVVSGG